MPEEVKNEYLQNTVHPNELRHECLYISGVDK